MIAEIELEYGSDRDGWPELIVWVAECLERYEVLLQNAVKVREERDQHIEQLEQKLAEQEKWFADNAAVLASHRIGGYRFDESAKPRQLHGNCPVHSLKGCSCAAAEKSRIKSS